MYFNRKNKIQNEGMNKEKAKKLVCWFIYHIFQTIRCTPPCLKFLGEMGVCLSQNVAYLAHGGEGWSGVFFPIFCI